MEDAEREITCRTETAGRRGLHRCAARIDHDHGALADDVERRAVHHDRGRFVDPDAHQRRMVDHRADQAVVALPLEKVLVDDDLRPEPEALRRSRFSAR